MLATAILAAYTLTFCGLALYSLHRAWLLITYRRLGSRRAGEWQDAWPRVTVQLPIYNERWVVERLIDAVAALDYPADRLQIQVLDDSDDETAGLARRRVEAHRREGLAIEHWHRVERRGFKAGALAEGLKRARGEFVLILDADFVPGPDLIRRMLGPFRDPAVGMVQARWGHLNEEASWLTRVQALLLDAHFHLEHGARAAAGLFFNFNGSAGMWRTACIRDAGGWESDTLTEDLDISYRAQIRGWRFEFLPGVVVPGELPESVRALKSQQARWAQGSVETARKVSGRLMRGPWPWRVKLEAAAHLSSYVPEALTLALSLLILPAIVVRFEHGWPGLLLFDLLFLLVALVPVVLYYGEAIRAGGRRPWPKALLYVPLALGLGVGLSVNNTRAMIRGMASRRASKFVRTPKRGGLGTGYRAPFSRLNAALETALASYTLAALVYTLTNGLYPSVPFLALFLWGFASIAGGSVLGRVD